MTKPVPIEAARAGLAYVELAAPGPAMAALRELADFALQFETRALPGLEVETVLAGEMNEIRLVDASIEAQSIDLIRINGRTFSPEVIELEDERTSADLVGKPLPMAALEQLREHQRQLDEDGVEVGVSREAVEEVLSFFEPDRNSVLELDPGLISQLEPGGPTS